MVTEVEQWKANDDAATTVVVGTQGSYNGTAARNTEDFNTTGKINGALDFNGSSDLVDCGSIAGIRSVAAWFKHDNPLKNHSRIFDWGSNQFSAYTDAFGNLIVVYAVITHTMLAVITQGVWYHLVVSHDGTDIRVYLNSVEQGSPYTRVLDDTADTFRIGRFGSAIQYWDGPLDDIRIYGEVLSQTNIDTLWNSGNGTEISLGLVPPTQVANPTPADGATEVSLSQVLSWDAAARATSYDVYFGTTSPPASIGNQAGLTYSPTITTEAYHYWRIDSVNSAGTTTGAEWSFKATDKWAEDSKPSGAWAEDSKPSGAWTEDSKPSGTWTED